MLNALTLVSGCRSSAVAFGTVLSFALHAQVLPDLKLADSTDLPIAVVVGNRAPVSERQVGHTLEVLTAEELARLPVATVAEALQFVGGLDLRQRGPRGVQADLSIRGGTFEQVLVLIDGVKLTDPQTGHHTLNIPVPLANVARIEVLKGPGARLYGQNAFAGVINVVTKVAGADGVEIGVEAGEYGSAGFSAGLNLRRNTISHTITYARDISAGYRYNTAYDVATTFYQARTTTQPLGELNFLAALTDREFGANGFYSSASAREQAEDIQTSVVAISQRKSLGRGEISTRLSWRRNQDEYVFLRRNPSVYRNLHLSHTVSLDSYYGLTTALGRLGVGVDLQAFDLSSNLLGQRQRLSSNLLVEHAFRWMDGRVEVTPGLTLNHLSDGGLTPLPGLDAVLRINELVKVYGNVGSTFRVPTYTELYYRDRFNVGDPDLRPECAVAAELGAQIQQGPWQFGTAFWQRHGSDLIDYVRDSPADTVWQATNINDTRFRGIELSAQASRLTPWLPNIYLSYNYIDGELITEEGFGESRYVLEQLRHQVLANATVAVWRFSLTPGFRYGDRVRSASTSELPVDYGVLDIRIDYRTPRMTLYVDATNVTDLDYTQTNGVPLPGRWTRAGFRVRL